jgi:hypothetical protein
MKVYYIYVTYNALVASLGLHEMQLKMAHVPKYVALDSKLHPLEIAFCWQEYDMTLVASRASDAHIYDMNCTLYAKTRFPRTKIFLT